MSSIGQLAQEIRRSRTSVHDVRLGRHAVQEGTCTAVYSTGSTARPAARIRLVSGRRVTVPLAAGEPAPVVGTVLRVLGANGVGDLGSGRVRLA